MCGLAGIVSSRVTALNDIFKMNRVQSHRGPDGAGVAIHAPGSLVRLPGHEMNAVSGLVALGHVRLSILDLSESGAQPMCAEEDRFVIVFNGEVYNFLELRTELAALGHSFRGWSDTEVVLAAFARWGTACFARFNGMWAIAILDRRKGLLTLSRDRFGIKPLHIAIDGERLLFASEIKSILAVRAAKPRLVRQQALSYLRDGLVNETDGTFVEGVQSFPAAHFAVVDLARPHRLNLERFWAPPPPSELGSATMDYRDAEAEFKSLLGSTVALHMRSDVPVGTCLSGGLDSSTIICLAAPLRKPGDAMDAFTAGFDDPALDERRYAAAVAEAAQVRHNIVLPDVEGLERDWRALVQAQEEPFGSLSIYAQWCVMRLSRERGVKVLLDGQGGDEVMAGYRKFIVIHILRLLRSGRLGHASRFIAGVLLRGDRGLLRIAEGKRYLPRQFNAQMGGIRAAVREGWKAEWEQPSPLGLGGTTVEQRQIDDLTSFSLPALLRYEDRNSMAFGIEARVPFLDYRLVEFMLRLSPDLKFANGRTKGLLRTAYRGTVPNLVLDRRDKLGFSPPQRKWLQGSFGQLLRCRFRSRDFRLGHLLDERCVDSLLDAEGHFADAGAGEAFRVFALDCWAEQFGVEC